MVTSRCLFTTTPCSFVSSLSSAPLTHRVSNTPFHPHAYLSFPHPSPLAVPLYTVVHGHVRSQYPRKITTPRSGCCMNARIEWPFLSFGCAGSTLQTTRSLFPTISRLLSSNASLNDADRCCMLICILVYYAPCRGNDPQAAVAENGVCRSWATHIHTVPQRDLCIRTLHGYKLGTVGRWRVLAVFWYKFEKNR